MSQKPSIVWFRQDLRVADNPALVAAAERGGPVIPLYIWAPGDEGGWALGGASRWWLHRSLASLGEDLGRLGSKLVVRQGDTLEALLRVIDETGSDAVFWNRRYEPSALALEAEVESALLADGLRAETFDSALLFDPREVLTGKGGPFRVFTAFWKACQRLPDPPTPLPAPPRLPAPHKWIEGLEVARLGLLEGFERSKGLEAAWRPGSEGAEERLDRFLSEGLSSYNEDRDRPDLSSTSRLSPHLHFGEISPRQLWHAVRARAEEASGGGLSKSEEGYLRQLGWREFACYQLFHFPHTAEIPLRPEFEPFPWSNDEEGLQAWREGRTGYPLVDAGMRELLSTGWMHNRLRMVVASFLVKDLLIAWLEGARWFWDTLVDADLANNTLGWQWVAGCGADAAPFFRIFNPVRQGERFDPEGRYVRRWVPELAGLPDRWIHAPWEAPRTALEEAGVELGRTYPNPIVNHRVARQRALAAMARIRKKKAGKTA